MPAAGGLSDALGRLASNEDRKPGAERAEREPEVEIRSAKSMRADETTVLSVDQIIPESTSEDKPRRRSANSAGPAAPRSSSTSRGSARPASSRRPASGRGGNRKPANHDLKRTAIPILLTVGGLLLIPGIWAVCLMLGLEVPRHDDPQANQVALGMLITWPLSLCMIGGAIFFWMQTSGEKGNRRQR